jgi:DNA-binding HxlR family transcriptional regulator
MEEKEIIAWSNECPLYQLFDLFGKKWTLHIFQSLYLWISTFSWLMRRLPQINSKVLAERLDLLVELWYVERVVSQNKPLKINYYLSNHWKELYSHLDNLTKWVLNWN